MNGKKQQMQKDDCLCTAVSHFDLCPVHGVHRTRKAKKSKS